jgi:hypothetical protein
VKKTFAFILITLLLAIEVYSQNYRQSAGLRLGAGGGITYRRLFDASIAGEVMLLSQNHGTVVAFLAEKQKPAVLFDDLNLNFFYGGGFHIGGANTEYCHDDPHDNFYYHHGYNTVQLGFDGFASFEYIIPRYPIALSLEAKPYFEFFDDQNFGLHVFQIAFGARYTF